MDLIEFNMNSKVRVNRDHFFGDGFLLRWLHSRVRRSIVFLLETRTGNFALFLFFEDDDDDNAYIAIEVYDKINKSLHRATVLATHLLNSACCQSKDITYRFNVNSKAY